MSISPPGDLVLEVARAADPQRAAAALRKLQQSAGESANGAFAQALGAAGSVPAPNMPAKAARVHAPEISGGPRTRAGSSVDPYSALGGVVLQKAIEHMMPAPSAATFGAGTAGSVWRSALAEHLATALSASVFKLPAKCDHTSVEKAPAIAASPVPAA